MRSVTIVLQKKHLIRDQLTKFESLLESGALFSKSLRKLYKLLTDNEKTRKKTNQFKWEKDLNVGVSRTEWAEADKYILDISVNVAICEAYYNLK